MNKPLCESCIYYEQRACHVYPQTVERAWHNPACKEYQPYLCREVEGELVMCESCEIWEERWENLKYSMKIFAEGKNMGDGDFRRGLLFLYRRLVDRMKNLEYNNFEIIIQRREGEECIK